MTWAPYIKRTELSLADLALNDATYRLGKPPDGWQSGIVWDREVATSAYTHGETLVGATKGMGIITARVLVRGSSTTDVNNKISTLLAAFSQFSYELHYVSDGVDMGWKCEPADYLADQRWLIYEDVHTAPVILTIPRHPTPVAGPF